MTGESDILAGLTEPQREAVTHIEGPLLVIAGAGSGKTRVITRRVAYLASQGVPPRRILAVTFTNKAAGEMRERIEQLCGTKGAWVSTFHSLCARMLRISAEAAGLEPNFTIYDRADQLTAVRDALRRLEIDQADIRPASALQTISNAKTKLLSPSQYAAAVGGFREERLAKTYRLYQEILDANAALDFDDLLMRVARLLESDEASLDRWQRRFDFLLIDEYQDTNRAQYRIAARLAGRHQNLCATGDPDQSIYGWRGADIQNILDFEKDFPSARVVRLEQNYRSTKRILQAADTLIAKNALRIERSLWTENEQGVPVRFLHLADADEEADRIVGEIRRRGVDGRGWGEIAVFYRTNAQSRRLEEALVLDSLPYRLVGAVEFYGRQEIKDLLAYLRSCVNVRDSLSLERVINTPSRGIGARTIERLKQWASESGRPLSAAVASVEEIPTLSSRAKKAVRAFADVIEGLRKGADGPVGELCRRVLDETGYAVWLKSPDNEERRENVAELLNKADDFDATNPGAGLGGFLTEVSLVSDVDNLDGAAEAVTLMTLHAAKGLEFPVVFLTGVEEGLLPHTNSMGSDAEIEEERRL